MDESNPAQLETMQDSGRAQPEAASSAPFRLLAGLCSQAGRREQNEDYAAFCLTPGLAAGAGAIVAIADGVGGGKGGRVAAELTVRSFIEGQLGQSELLGVRRTAMRSLEAINGWIHAIGRRDPELAGMASTFSGLVLRGRRGFLLHVGDSRIYRQRDNRLDLLTADHAYRLPAYRNVLTRAIGVEDSVKIDYSEIALSEYDRYLCCSDGVHGFLSDERLRALLAQHSSPDDAAREIVEAALANGGDDNVTALIFDVVALPPADMAELTSAFAAKPILPAPKPGEKVDGFQLTKIISDGNYYRVFEALDDRSGETVVVKFPKPNTAPDAAFRQVFLREAWIAAKVRNPYVGRALEIPDDRQSGLYLAMPFYAGETLEQRLARPPRISLTTGLALALALARGVAALHRAGVIHRDIKTENVILEEPRRNERISLKLIDFGIARLPSVDDRPGAESDVRSAPGTPSYMAPELFTGAQGDQSSDQFALGVTLYRMFTVAFPYNEIEPFTQPRLRDPIQLQTRRPDLPAWLDRAIMRCVAVKPNERFADVLELVFELEHGADRPMPHAPRRRSLYDRNPLVFWKITAGLLFFALIAALLKLASLKHLGR